MTDLLLGLTAKNERFDDEDLAIVVEHSHYQVIQSMHTNHNTPRPLTEDEDGAEDDFSVDSDLLQLQLNDTGITPKSISRVMPFSDSNMSPSTRTCTHSHHNSAYRILLCAYLKHRNVSHELSLQTHTPTPHCKQSHSLSLAYSTTNEIAWAMDSENEECEDSDSDEWSVHTKSVLLECEEELENATLQNLTSFYSVVSNNSVSTASSISRISDICLTFPTTTRQEERWFDRSQKDHNALIRNTNIAQTRAIGEDLFHKYHIQAWQRAQKNK